jgi:hypothetical protein
VGHTQSGRVFWDKNLILKNLPDENVIWRNLGDAIKQSEHTQFHIYTLFIRLFV